MLRNLALILGLTVVAATAAAPAPTDSHNTAVAGSHDASKKDEAHAVQGTETDKATTGSGELQTENKEEAPKK